MTAEEETWAMVDANTAAWNARHAEALVLLITSRHCVAVSAEWRGTRSDGMGVAFRDI
ncbi:MAG TPA: hypothetical protein VIY90_10745 [Steroidobacteraceae bacterium]